MLNFETKSVKSCQYVLASIQFNVGLMSSLLYSLKSEIHMFLIEFRRNFCNFVKQSTLMPQSRFL